MYMYDMTRVSRHPWTTNRLHARLANHLIARGTLSIRAQRKLFNTAGALGVAGGFVCLAFLRCTSPYAALVVLALVLASVSLSIPGCMVAVSDLAPNYTGTIMGIINTVGQTVGFLAPLISTSILEGNVRTLPGTQFVFQLGGILYFIQVGFLQFGTFGECFKLFGITLGFYLAFLKQI